LNLAKKWLETCLRDHVSCQNRNHPTDGWAPTRLLKVTGFRTSVFSMKLCLGSDLKAGTRYLTLSHCWGGRDIVKLTENMLSSFKQDIPLSLLPQNFKDAAALTLFLGYEYLWIDSLCIVQDSPADWAREAAVMGDIYRYSLCTIAALGAADPHGGCFLERSALSFVPCQLFLDPQTQRGVYAENWRNPSPNSSQASSRARLLTRGWVLQESALSPRTLYFGSDMLYYSCTSTHISEAERTQSSSSYRPNIKQRFYDLLDKVEKGEDYYSWAPFWWNIIRDYTACDLTVLSDKWPAISGLAAVVQSKSDTRLVHGLWEKHLVSEIMWRASAPRNNRRINEEMPSWSWIGINEPV
ncbi:heterokaryon incompatibility protein-domain-containing protein, partial [Stachybotrys elegans]